MVSPPSMASCRDLQAHRVCVLPAKDPHDLRLWIDGLEIGPLAYHQGFEGWGPVEAVALAPGGQKAAVLAGGKVRLVTW